MIIAKVLLVITDIDENAPTSEEISCLLGFNR